MEVVAEIAIEFLIIRLDWGVGNFVYYYIVVQAGLGFDVDTSTALYLTVATEAAVEIAVEVLVEVVAEIFVV